MREVIPGGKGFPAMGFCKQLKLVLFDVDGVLTDGRVVIDGNGVESKFFDVKDGTIMKWLMRHGLQVGLLTGRSSSVVTLRAKELGLPPECVRQGAKQKLPVYLEILQTLGVQKQETAFVGDDLLDLPILLQTGLPCCPADARSEVKAVCRLQSEASGGRGAVRQICEWILRDRGDWEAVLRRYQGESETIGVD
jgi:3-deoxy-D-manno-octulosonate 8-phosphate phosphatase (KDO 8-P phosphatase)